MTTIKTKRADVAPLVAATFPDYKGRKITVQPATSVMLHSLNWDGGSRSQYRTCSTDGAPIGSADRYNAMAPWANPAEGQNIPVPQGAVVVRHSIFSGKDAGLTIYINPADMPAWLENNGG